MKTDKFLLIGACAALLLSACALKEDIPGEQPNLKTVSIEVAHTRTALDGTAVKWTAGDEIKVCYKGGWGHNYKFSLASSDGAGQSSPDR